jgi:hypothetical protein
MEQTHIQQSKSCQPAACLLSRLIKIIVLDTEKKYSLFLKLEVETDPSHSALIHVKGSIFAKFWRVQAS